MELRLRATGKRDEGLANVPPIVLSLSRAPETAAMLPLTMMTTSSAMRNRLADMREQIKLVRGVCGALSIRVLGKDYDALKSFALPKKYNERERKELK